MADSKYADLPGIAYDQPDVYETEDLPEADQNIEQAEEENESIEKPHLSVENSLGKFKGKVLLKESVDFSDRISKSRRIGYDARSCEFELVGAGEKETPLQKYRRLQCELNELSEDIEKLKESNKEGSGDSTAISIDQVQLLMKQLNHLKIEEQLGTKLIANLADPQGSTLKKLLSQMETIKNCESSTVKTGDKKPKISEDQGGAIQYELLFRPEYARLNQTTKLAQIEQRIHNLETTLGDMPEKMSWLSTDTHNMPLYEAVQLLNGKINLLDSSQLDHIEGRLTALTDKMNDIQAKSAPKEILEQEKKINELYELAMKCENISALLPQTEERMLSLQALQERAVSFGSSLAQLDSVQEEIVASLTGNDNLLKQVQKNFNDNLEVMKKNIVSLEDRVSALKKK